MIRSQHLFVAGARRAGPVAGLDPLFRSLRVDDFAATPRRERQKGSCPTPPARWTKPTRRPRVEEDLRAERWGSAALPSGEAPQVETGGLIESPSHPPERAERLHYENTHQEVLEFLSLRGGGRSRIGGRDEEEVAVPPSPIHNFGGP